MSYFNKPKEGVKTQINKDQLTYLDVIGYNDSEDYYSELGIKRRNSYGDEDQKFFKTDYFFLKNSDGKRLEFYNEKNSLFLDQTDFLDREYQYKGYKEKNKYEILPNNEIIGRHLLRNKINDKKYVVLRFDPKSHNFKNCNTFKSIDEVDKDYGVGRFVEDAESDFIKIVYKSLPNTFKRNSVINGLSFGFFDEIKNPNDEDIMTFIIPKRDVLYDSKFPIIKKVSGFEMGERNKKKKYNSELLDVVVPNKLLLESTDWRNIEKKIDSHKNGTDQIEIPMKHMFIKTSASMEKEYEELVKDIGGFGNTKFHSPSVDLHYDSFDYINGYEVDKEFDELSASTNEEKKKMVKDRILQNKETSINRLEHWKAESISDIDNLIKSLSETKSSIETNSESVKKTLNELEVKFDLEEFKDPYIDNFINDKIVSPNYKGEDEYKDLATMKDWLGVDKRWGCGNSSVMGNLNIITLKKLRSGGSEMMKSILNGSTISDTSISRNWRKNKLKIGYESTIDSVISSILKEYFESLTESEDRLYDYILNGDFNVRIYQKERWVKSLIIEIENLKVSKNKKIFDVLDKDIEYLNSLLNDKPFFKKSGSVLNIGVIDDVNENTDLINEVGRGLNSWVEKFKQNNGEGSILPFPKGFGNPIAKAEKVEEVV